MKALAEEELARVRVAIEAVEEARCMVEVEVTRLEVERTSLMLDIGADKDEVSSFQSQTGKENESMGEDYQKAFFAYGYGVVRSNTKSMETRQRFQMGCPTPPTHYHQSSSRTPGAPWLERPLRLQQTR